MDSLLITLVVVIIAALSNWLQNRAQNRDAEPPHGTPMPPRPLRPRPPRQPRPPHGPEREPEPEMNLEEALRRLLGGEPPVAPKRPRIDPAPPPPPVHEAPRLPQPAPPLMPVAPPMPMATTSTPVARPHREERLSEASQAYGRVRHLHESVTRRLREVHNRTETTAPSAPMPTRPRSGVSEPFLAIRGNPEAARRAFVASLIFGTPKGLEP